MTGEPMRWILAASLLCLPAACGSGPNGTGDGNDDGSEAGDDADDGTDGPEMPVPTTRFFRLSHAQWENTVQDLFYLAEPTGFSGSFRTDPQVSGFIFDNNVLSLEVDEALWKNYRVAASQVAEMVTSDPDVLARILPADGGDEAARARAFVETFAARAYRRPVSDAEITDLLAQFEGGPALYPGVEVFVAGVRHVIDSVLQSPNFIYRIETSTTVDGDVIPLNDFELASRLSYFLLNSMPDDELFDLAGGGALTDPASLELQARRLLDDPRAEAVVNRFHQQMLDVESFASIMPSPAFYPNVSPDIGEHAITENEMFLRDVVFGRDGSWADVLTSNETFVNAELAAIYGIEGTFDDTFTAVTLDDQQRRGLLTQVGFLASNASSVDPDPIHRGVFVARHLACMTIAAPPADIPPLPPLEPTQTNRERVEAHTEVEDSVCSSCHTHVINPLGFPFEYYDAVGAFRTEDNGKPVDGATEAYIGFEAVQVQNAVDLIDALAASRDVHECYVRHWLEFAGGRPFEDADQPVITRLGAQSVDENASIKQLVLGLVTSRTFVSRAAEEMQ